VAGLGVSELTPALGIIKGWSALDGKGDWGKGTFPQSVNTKKERGD